MIHGVLTPLKQLPGGYAHTAEDETSMELIDEISHLVVEEE